MLPIADIPEIPPVSHPVPAGYLSSRDVFRHVLAIWWGPICNDSKISVEGEAIESNDRLWKAALDGMWQEATQLIREASTSGLIEPLLRSEAEFIRLTPEHWHVFKDNDEWESRLFLGELYPPVPYEIGWARDLPILFEREPTEHWLRGLESPHVLPEPLRQDPAGLPDEPYVPLTDAITWLASAASKSQNQMLVEAFGEGLEHKAQAWFDAHPRNSLDSEQLAEIATYVAETARLNIVERRLRRALAQGDIQAFGRRGSFTDGPREERKPIPREVFLESVKLAPIIGGIIVDGSPPDVDILETARVGQWIDVRFIRSDLARLWGLHTVPDDDTQSADATASVAKGGRPLKYDWTKAQKHFLELWDHHGPFASEDPEWNCQADAKRAIAEWFKEQIGVSPSDSAIREKVARWISELRTDG